MRLYKIEITNVPAECDPIHLVSAGDNYVTNHREWKPEGWDEYVSESAERGELWAQNCTYFFWPSTDKFYRSRSSAAEKVAIVERWGGEARILEAQVSEFVPIAEANRRRQEERDRVRAQKLRKKAAEIMAKHDVPF